MTEVPLVSVIVATYNRAELLGISLQSAIAQEFTNIEILVIGDGCTDHSEQVVSGLNDPRISWENLPENHLAPHAAHNRGIQKARGEYIAYLHHDDLWLPWHLSNLVSRIEKEQADLVYDMTCSVGKDESGTVCFGEVPHFRKTVHGMASCWLHRNPLMEGSMLWLSPYDVGNGTDSDFISRLKEKQGKIIYEPRLGVIRFGSSNWQTYGSEQLPQPDYLRRLKDSPHALQLELLQTSCNNMSKDLIYAHCKESTTRLVKNLLRHWAWEIIGFYGVNRFPVSLARRAWFRRSRRKMNLLRGL